MFKKKKTKDDHSAETPSEGAAEGAEGHEGEGKKKPPLKLIIIAAAGALVVLGGGGVGAFLFLGKKAPAEGEHAEAAAEGGHAAPAKEEKKGGGGHGAAAGADGESPITEGPDGVIFYTMPDMVVNIQAPDGRPTFLKLKLAFELPDAHVAESLEPNSPRLADMFQTFLRELRPEDLSGSQGSYQLRMEILRRVNLVIAPSKVNAVLIQEMLIQ
jgi:flagellar FliL protein